MELDIADFYRVEQIFNRSLLSILNVELWSMYLNYVRRRNNLTTDTTGTARQVVAQAYDFVLKTIGIDKDAGYIWRDYVKFLHSGPGEIGGNGWQDLQKVDSLRKAYHQALVVPTDIVDSIWAEYTGFEMGLNRATASCLLLVLVHANMTQGRTFLQAQIAGHIQATQAYSQLKKITANLNRSTIPRLPPARGFNGDLEHQEQIRIWHEWIDWEKTDPLLLKTDGDDGPAKYKSRILYVYKQATITMRFEPEFWYEAAEFCFANELETDGERFIDQGMAANPESCLLAFRQADRIESRPVSGEGPDAVKRQGDTVREPYNKLLDALYSLIKQTEDREKKAVARVQERFAHQPSELNGRDSHEDYDDAQKAREAAQEVQIKAIQAGSAAQIEHIRTILSHVWIGLMRAMRRVQGKGKPGAEIGGFRGVFTDARKRGRITSEVYVASALIEHQCYKDPAATKIFERGMKLFPEDENFALEYVKHLIDINDATSKFSVPSAISLLTSRRRSSCFRNLC